MKRLNHERTLDELSSAAAYVPKDNDSFQSAEIGSLTNMFAATETMKLVDLLQQVNLRRKYSSIFKHHGVDTIDEFMELEPEQLEALNIEEGRAYKARGATERDDDDTDRPIGPQAPRMNTARA